jgi:hypothetical protein
VKVYQSRLLSWPTYGVVEHAAALPSNGVPSCCRYQRVTSSVPSGLCDGITSSTTSSSIARIRASSLAASRCSSLSAASVPPTSVEWIEYAIATIVLPWCTSRSASSSPSPRGSASRAFVRRISSSRAWGSPRR